MTDDHADTDLTDHHGEAEALRRENERLRAALAALAHDAEPGPPFVFDRYVNGQLMAEGVRIDRKSTLADATVAAANLASRGPNGEVPVLVLTHPSDAESLRGRTYTVDPEAEVAAARKEAQSLRAEVENLERQIDSFMGAQNRIEAECDAAFARIADLEAQIAALTPPPDAELDALVAGGRDVADWLADCGYEDMAISTQAMVDAITALRAKAEVSDVERVATWVETTGADGYLCGTSAGIVAARIRAALEGGAE